MIALLPPIGIVQMGRQAMADRFTYIPSIGLALAVVWGLGDLLRGRPRLAAWLAGGAVAACAFASWSYTAAWRDSVTVFDHAIRVTAGNPAAQHYLAAALEDRGLYDAALPHHAEAVRLEPAYFVAQCSYGLALERRGEFAASAEHFTQAVRYFPTYAEARFHLGLDLMRLGQPVEARRQLERALQLGLDDRDTARARQELGP